MFVDASAIIAIIAQEQDWLSLAARLERAERVHVSPLSIWEATVGLVRERKCPLEEAEQLVRAFIEQTGATVIPITDSIGHEALKAFERYGKGRHKAKLNFGDCFAYACARVHGVPLLFKGDDFSETDIDAA